MKLLFLCNTLYQTIAASCIRQMYPDSEAHLILSDHSVANRTIYERLRRHPVIFDRIFYVESKWLYEDLQCGRWERIKKQMRFQQKPPLETDNGAYDMVFYANSEPYSQWIVCYLKKHYKNTVFCWYEDGLSAYCFDRRYFRKSLHTGMTDRVKAWMHIHVPTDVVSRFYVFQPEMMEWQPKVAVTRIAPLDDRLRLQFNDLFDYSHCEDRYEQKYIFLEDGFVDWKKNEDLALVEQIAAVVGRENIMVKRHPRNPEDRFSPLGYVTNQDAFVPWEIIASNIDIQNKVLITMYSQSVVTSEILMNKKATSIIMAKLYSDYDKGGHELFDYMNRNYYSQSPDCYYVVSEPSELKAILSKTEERTID